MIHIPPTCYKTGLNLLRLSMVHYTERVRISKPSEMIEETNKNRTEEQVKRAVALRRATVRGAVPAKGPWFPAGIHGPFLYVNTAAG
jgi:hypothetical protein